MAEAESLESVRNKGFFSLIYELCLGHEVPCLNLTSLFLDLSPVDCVIVDVINKGLTPNLNSFGISMREQELSLQRQCKQLNIELLNLKSLHSLTLQHYVSYPSYPILIEIGKYSSRLQKLDISYFRIHKQRPSRSLFACIGLSMLRSSQRRSEPRLEATPEGFEGNLSVLLRHSFPSLNSLVLSDCGLNSQDLCSLAQASVEGRLPQLRHLDISRNTDVHFHEMFQASCTWDKLLKLNITEIRHFDQLSEAMHSGCLNSLREISISGDQILSYKWESLQRICICPDFYLLKKVDCAVDEGRFPSLRTVCIQYETHVLESNFYKEPAIHSLLQKNISVHQAFLPYYDPFLSAKCLCQLASGM